VSCASHVGQDTILSYTQLVCLHPNPYIHTYSLPGSSYLKSIAHIDLDCFFVSVERIKDPTLIGKPVLVGGSATGRGVVASASYEARAFGVRSAMPTGQALRLCPSAIVVSGRHGEYSLHSNRLYKRLLEIAPVVERASIDEMYLDFTGCESLYDGDLPGYMKKLQTLVRDEFELPATIALASNKLVAKVAANTVKPAGVIHVPHGTEEVFLAKLPIEALPGVGKKTEAFLKKRGFHFIRDLQELPEKKLIALLGAHGEWLYRASHGRGSTHVHEDGGRKSISKEETFWHDISGLRDLEKQLFVLVEDVASTLRRKCLLARTVTLKYRLHTFKTFTRSETIPPTNYDPAILETAIALLRRLHTASVPVRLIGIGVSNLVGDVPPDEELFPPDSRRTRMLKAVDALRGKYGANIVDIGSA